MTAFDDEVDPFETRDATPSHYLEEDSDELLRRLAVRLGFGPQFEHASHVTPQR